MRNIDKLDKMRSSNVWLFLAPNGVSLCSFLGNNVFILYSVVFLAGRRGGSS